MGDEMKPPRTPTIELKPDLDGQLRRYLSEAQKERDEGHTVGALHRDVQDIKIEQHETNRRLEEQNVEIKQVRLRQDRHGKDIRELKRRVFHSDEWEDKDTGVHQVEDLRRHLASKEAELKEHKLEIKEQRDSIWWKRQKVQWLGATIGASIMLVVGGVGTVTWYLLMHVGGK